MCITFANPSEPCCAPVEPIPLSGYVYRYYQPTILEDYEGLADAAWSDGTTGETSPARNAVAVYHHRTTPNARTTSVFNILPPVRWSVTAPDTDGGTYEQWSENPTFAGHFRESNGFQTGYVGIRERLIPRGSHCRFRGDISNIPGPGQVPVPNYCHGGIYGSAEYAERSLQAIAPGFAPWQYDGSDDVFPVSVSVFAFRHRINGNPGPLHIGDAVQLANNWRFRIRPTDTYEIDLWYRIGIEAALHFPTTPAKLCVYIPFGVISDGNTSRQSQLMLFGNVDFSPAFNWQKQTYAVSIGGHRGWTLKNGSNGPHKIATDEDWEASNGAGGVNFVPADYRTGYVERIALNFEKEIAEVLLVTGPKMRPAGTPEGVGKVLLYRSEANANLYRRRTRSTRYGEIEHASPGMFNQAGTTVFRLVPWSWEAGYYAGTVEDVGHTVYLHESEGRTTANPVIPRTVPKTITLTRVHK